MLASQAQRALQRTLLSAPSASAAIASSQRLLSVSHAALQSDEGRSREKVGHERDVRPRHFRLSNQEHPLYVDRDKDGKPVWVNPTHNKVWTEEEVLNVRRTHVEPKDLSDRAAHMAIRIIRKGFDIFSGYAFGPINESKFLRRVIFLETVAGIPGMVAGSLRHLMSLRTMRRDHGWIATLLEEAENERMHLLTFQQLRNPGIIFRSTVLVAQGIFWNAYFLAYMVSPRTCHRFIGYLEEEAVLTYTHAIEALDDGRLPTWNDKDAPDIAKTYWGLAPDATMRDVLLAVRADEANHRDVNHTLSSIKADDINPFVYREATADPRDKHSSASLPAEEAQRRQRAV